MHSTFIGMAVVALFGIAPLSAQAAKPGLTLYEGGKPRSSSLTDATETRFAQPGFSGRRADVRLVEKTTLPYVGPDRVRYAATYKRMRYAAYYRDARERCCTIYSGKARHTCIGEARVKYIQ
ncbi:MAG: hypothetical protein Q8K62_05925 [Thiobacillus sp.]|nr:hypothetical protein [Pseudohongiella sp.]MDP1928034.1 hypothetical protein [Thiobacillus sp.]